MTKAAARTVSLPGGVEMPVIGFGTWQLTGQSAYRAIRDALATGYRHIDTATMYGNEDEVGRAVRDSGLDRAEVFITTKLPPERAGRERDTLDASLQALGTDHVDLWLIHWPPSRRSSPKTWQELLAVRDEGLARAVGVSNYGTDQIDELVEATGEAPAVNQVRWAPALHDARVLAEHQERGVVLEGYSPFKSTNLRDSTITSIAQAHQATPAQVVLRWHLEHGIIVIPKSEQPERIKGNFDVFGFSLTPEEVNRIDALSRR